MFFAIKHACAGKAPTNEPKKIKKKKKRKDIGTTHINQFSSSNWWLSMFAIYIIWDTIYIYFILIKHVILVIENPEDQTFFGRGALDPVPSYQRKASHSYTQNVYLALAVLWLHSTCHIYVLPISLENQINDKLATI